MRGLVPVVLWFVPRFGRAEWKPSSRALIPSNLQLPPPPRQPLFLPKGWGGASISAPPRPGSRLAQSSRWSQVRAPASSPVPELPLLWAWGESQAAAPALGSPLVVNRQERAAVAARQAVERQRPSAAKESRARSSALRSRAAREQALLESRASAGKDRGAAWSQSDPQPAVSSAASLARPQGDREAVATVLPWRVEPTVQLPVAVAPEASPPSADPGRVRQGPAAMETVP